MNGTWKSEFAFATQKLLRCLGAKKKRPTADCRIVVATKPKLHTCTATTAVRRAR